MTGLYTASEWLEHSVACIREKYVPDNRCWTFDTQTKLYQGKYIRKGILGLQNILNSLEMYRQW